MIVLPKKKLVFMDIIHIIVLSIVQGLTEFLPISSSAHLILVPKLLGWEDQGLAFDVATHVGTLLAVIYYFRKDLIVILRDFFLSIKKREMVRESNVAWAIGFATIPVGICGLLFGDYIGEYLRSPLVIAFSTIFFGIALYIADKMSGEKSELNITLKDAVIIGIAQAIALIPGTSRSGITIMAALMLGFSKKAAARFSFLMSIPVIILAGGLEGVKIVKSSIMVDWSSIGAGIFLSFIGAYICIYLFLKFIERAGMTPFVIYRLILGMFLFYLFWV